MREALNRAYRDNAGAPRTQMGGAIRVVEMAVTVSGFCLAMPLLKKRCVYVDDGTAQVDWRIKRDLYVKSTHHDRIHIRFTGSKI